MEKMNLDQLAIKYGNDKSSLFHNYMKEYEKHFKSLQGSARIILELGVWTGTSLRIWEEYFASAKIFGVDIFPQCKRFEGGRREVFIGNQQDLRFLDSVVRATGAPDVIIDDCGHVLEHQIASLTFLWPKLKRGGIYAIEDILSPALDRLLIITKQLQAPVQAVYKGDLRNEMLLILKKPLDPQGV